MDKSELIEYLKRNEIVKYGDFTLKSGIKSNYYFDLRTLLDTPKIITHICTHLYKLIIAPGNSKIKLCGVPYGALSYSNFISCIYDIPQIMIRKERKAYGCKNLIEGHVNKNEKIVLIEDVVTSGSSVLELIEKLKEENIEVHQIIVIVDRSKNNMENVKSQGHNIISLFKEEDFKIQK